MVNSLEDFEIQDNEAQQLINFEIHPETLFICDFHYQSPPIQE